MGFSTEHRAVEKQGAQRRGSDGRRRFSAEFKRVQIGLVVRKELTFAELSRELGIDQSVVRRWQHLAEGGSRTAVAANETVVPTALRAAQQRIRELERTLGKWFLQPRGRLIIIQSTPWGVKWVRGQGRRIVL